MISLNFPGRSNFFLSRHELAGRPTPSSGISPEKHAPYFKLGQHPYTIAPVSTIDLHGPFNSVVQDA
jgi:hypothetical protein